MIFAKDGRTRDVPPDQYWYWIGQGWTPTEQVAPTPAPAFVVSTVTVVDGMLTVTYADGSVDTLGGLGGGTGGTTGVTIDTDGVPYFTDATGTAPVLIDDDGRPYFPGA